ncbi:hypothetical protein G7046_g48 [Stylonectria norvegica]|nr:hypothetical protein G7046_g48 [Stylonectria norvegica]
MSFRAGQQPRTHRNVRSALYVWSAIHIAPRGLYEHLSGAADENEPCQTPNNTAPELSRAGTTARNCVEAVGWGMEAGGAWKLGKGSKDATVLFHATTLIPAKPELLGSSLLPVARLKVSFDLFENVCEMAMRQGDEPFAAGHVLLLCTSSKCLEQGEAQGANSEANDWCECDDYSQLIDSQSKVVITKRRLKPNGIWDSPTLDQSEAAMPCVVPVSDPWMGPQGALKGLKGAGLPATGWPAADSGGLTGVRCPTRRPMELLANPLAAY